MDPLGATIAVNVLSSFIADVLKWIAGAKVPPLEEAIASTVTATPEVEDLDTTLRQWLSNPNVQHELSQYLEGVSGLKDLSLDALADALVNRTQFFLPSHSDITAKKIITTFLVKVRASYLSDPRFAPLHLANRQEVRFDSLERHIERLSAAVESGGGLRPAIQKHFDSAVKAYEDRKYPEALSLFTSLLLETEGAPLRDRDLERRIHVYLGKIDAALGNNEDAVTHYTEAAQLDDDQVRRSVNAAIADLIRQDHATALARLEKLPVLNAELPYEYWSAKAGALLGLKRSEEALEAATAAPVAEGKEAQRHELLGLVYRELGELSKAEEFYASSVAMDPKRPEAAYALAEILFTPSIEYRNEHPATPLPPDFKVKLDRASALLEEAAATFRQQGRNHAANEVDANLAVVRGLQDRFPESIRLLEPLAREDAPAHTWRTLGFAYLCTNEPSKAANAFKNALKSESDSNTELLYVQALIMSGRADEAQVVTSTRATLPVSQDNVKWHVMKAEALAAKRQFSLAREVLLSVQERYPNNPQLLLSLAELNEATGNDSAAESAYEMGLKFASGPDELRLRYQFGGFCAKKKDFARAIELWTPIIRFDKPNTLLDNYIRALYNTRRLSQLTSIAARFRAEKLKPSAMFADITAAAYQRLDDLSEASHWLEYLCDNFGNKPEHIVRLANIKVRLGKRDEAIDLLDASRTSLTKPSDQMSYAQAYSMLGKHRDALDLAEVAVAGTTTPDIHFAYIGVFLASPEDLPRTPSHVTTFQDILGKFRERFPNATQLQSFTIDPDNPLDAIRDTLLSLEKQAKNAVANYKDNRVPLEMFSVMLGRDLYDTWVHVIADPQLNIICAYGSEEEAAEFQRTLTDASGFIISDISLFTVAHLGLLQVLHAIGDVYVGQQSLDHLHELQAKRQLTGKQSGTMGTINGQFFIHEVSADDVEKMNSALNAATAWAESSGNPTGLRDPLSGEDKKWIRILGRASVASIAIARQRNLVLITDEKIVGEIAKQTNGISSVNTQAILGYLRSRDLISQDLYDKSVLRLVESGYTFIRVEEQQFYTVIVEEQFQITDRLNRVIGVMEPATTTLVPACLVVAGLLRRLYLEPVPDELRERLAFHILDILARNHSKLDVQRLVRTFLRTQMTPLLVYQLRKVEQLLDRW